MAALSTQTIPVGGAALTFNAAAGGGDTVTYQNGLHLLFKNGSGSTITVTLTSEAADTQTVAATDKAISVAAGAENLYVLNDVNFKDTDGNTALSYSSATSLTVAVYKSA